jgi:hypothetical protein
MNLREPEDLHGDVRDLGQLVLMMKMMRKAATMKGDQRKRDGWMDGQN